MKSTTYFTHNLFKLGLALAFGLSACGPGTTPPPTTDVNAIFTQAAATIVVELSQTAQAAPTATATLIPSTNTPETSPVATTQPDLPPTATATPPPAAIPVLGTSPAIPTPTVDASAAFGCYNATLLADLSVPYGSTFEPGNKFTKTWRIKNTGTCDWNRNFQIMHYSGDSFGAGTQTINQKIPAGGIAEISLAMTAPSLPGTISSTWRMATDIGKPFGSLLGLTVTLPAAAVTTPTGCYNAALVSDVTIPSGAEITQGQTFTKTWLIKNTGTCAWNSSFKITYVGGDLLGSDTTRIRQSVPAGGSAEISLPMIAPSVSGQVTSAWQMASDEGNLFGQIFTIVVNIK